MDAMQEYDAMTYRERNPRKRTRRRLAHVLLETSDPTEQAAIWAFDEAYRHHTGKSGDDLADLVASVLKMVRPK